MKEEIARKIILKLKSMDKSMKRKLFIGAGILSAFVVTIMVLLGILIFNTGSYVVSKAQELGSQVSVAPPNIEGLKTVPLNAPAVVNCMNRISGLFAIEPWILSPIPTILQSVIDSCWPKNILGNQCWEGSCNEEKTENETTTGETI